MDTIFCQSVTNETVSIVRERYSSFGWGEVRLIATGSNVTELHFKWCAKGQPMFPEVSDLGLSFPHML